MILRGKIMVKQDKILSKKILNKKPRIAVLAYGGTIACKTETPFDEFYDCPTLSIQEILSNIPLIDKVVEIQSEQMKQIISQEMSCDDLISLAQKINLVIQDENIDGVVITHGTNCMEEMAYFVSLVVNTEKPIVFTGAMKPSTSLCFDGLMNLYNSILIASSPKAKKLGVVLCFNNSIYSARNVTKYNPSLISAFGNELSLLGYVEGNKIFISNVPAYQHTYSSEFSIDKLKYFPKVYIIYGYLGMDNAFVDAAIANNAIGIVSAGMGKGYQPKTITKALAQAVEKGLIVVRSSRIGEGIINHDPETDGKYHFIAGGSLSPQKARILLSVALTKTKDKKVIQDIFVRY